jgi:predicted amidohydrolase
VRVAVLQLSSQGMSNTKLYNYIRIAHKQGVKLLLLGEYIVNPFFKELEELSISMIKEQAQYQIKVLKELSSTYDITIVVPIVIVKKNKPYKTVAKFAPSSSAYYYQQLLINYSHWNEEKYFANDIQKLVSPLIFKINSIKFAILTGFELHFDEIFTFLKEKNIDCILVPSVSTFGSFKRWEALATARAFVNNCYILRANRIGEYNKDDECWKFYGDSFFISPNGEILQHLGNTEELMIVDVNHTEVLQARKFWGFKEAIHKRERL